MEGDFAGVADTVWDGIEGISTTVWVALGVLTAALIWLVKWAVTVLFVQGRGISLITVPFSRLAGKILEDKFAQKLADTKVLPKLHIPRSWDEFNRFNGHVANRMRVYRELVYLVQAKFNGPTAISLRIAVRYFERNFVETFQTAEMEFRTLDRLDGEVRLIHRALHSELAAATHALERERIQTEKNAEMARIRLKQVIANRPMTVWLRRRSGRFFSAFLGWIANRVWSAGEEREIRAEKRDLDRRLRELRRDLDEESHLIFARHEEEVVGICLELIEHDQMFLQHLYHRFWLEMESLTFTVASGRLMHMIAADTDAAAEARRELGLADIPAFGTQGGVPDIHAIRASIRSDPDLQRYVGLGPEAVLEGSLEPYLRVKLLLKKIALPGYSTHWIAHLPPPAEFGRAQAEYDHFAHQLAWLKTAIPGIYVQENGLVQIDDASGDEQPPIAAEQPPAAGRNPPPESSARRSNSHRRAENRYPPPPEPLYVREQTNGEWTMDAEALSAEIETLKAELAAIKGTKGAVSPLAPKKIAEATPVAGVTLASIAAGVRYRNRDDVMLARLEPGTAMAGVFTRSSTRSSPVLWCESVLARHAKSGPDGKPVGILVNSGNSNAFTGAAGDESTRALTRRAAAALETEPESIYLASTGVIGERLPHDRIEAAIDGLIAGLAPDRWLPAARAIMTTDTFPKLASASARIDGVPVTISGFTKGSGMIAPDMATMLGFIFTDAAIGQEALQALLSRETDDSFNAITVDGDTSTSDTVLLAATGKAEHEPVTDAEDERLRSFRVAFRAVMRELAQQIIRDGEGATKFIEVRVNGAESNASAKAVALSIANSPLVKTAFAGEDPNWGRIVMAVGKSGQPADRDALTIHFGDVLVAEKGWVSPNYREEDGAAYMKGEELVLTVDMGIGTGEARVWTCDLTHRYIAINADYRS